MRLWAEEIKDIEQRLQDEHRKGNTVVAYNSELGYARTKDLLFFRDDKSFEKFAKQNNNEHALYFEWGTKHVLNAIDKMLHKEIDFRTSPSFHYADGIYSIYDPMNLRNMDSLKEQLTGLFFFERVFSALDYYNENPQERFTLAQRDRRENEKSLYYVHVEQDRHLDYRLTGYDAILRVAPEIPDVTVGQVNARLLDKDMKGIDWSVDPMSVELVEEYIKTKEGREFLDRIEVIHEGLNRLYTGGTEGKDAAERLAYKHWYGEPWELNTLSLEHIRKLYEFKHEVDLEVTPHQTRLDTYELLKSNAAACLAAMPLTKEQLDSYTLIDNRTYQPLEIKPGEELLVAAKYFGQINRQWLENTISKIGFEEPVQNEVYDYIKNQCESFDVTIPKQLESDKVKFQLYFEDAGNGWYNFKRYDAILYHQMAVVHNRINGINTEYIEDAMKKADWFFEYAESPREWEKGFAEVEKIKDALKQLSRDETGRVVATQLWNNHVPFFTVAKPSYISKCEEENDMYLTLRFSAGTHIMDAYRDLKTTLAVKQAILEHDAAQANDYLYPSISIAPDAEAEIKEFLKQEKLAGNHWVAYCDNFPVMGKDQLQCFRSNFEVQEYCYESSTDIDAYNFHSIYRIEKELEKSIKEDAPAMYHSQLPTNESQLKNTAMTEKEFEFIERQFKGLGVKEALTPTLIEQLKDGVSEVQHPFNKQYEGEGEARGLFYIKKGSEGNLYFLNKWDMEAVKPGEKEGLKQTFFNNYHHRNPNSEYYDASKFQTTFTFKSSFNYLMGRPVHNIYKNDNNQQQVQWDQLKIKKDSEGKITTEPKYYKENYPFDLEKMLGNYNILDLTNKEYKERLTQSYQRGNMQLVTFVDKDGKKEKLYTTPNIPLNAMHVYDSNRKPVSLDTQIEKGYVQKEYGEKLKETIKQLSQKNGSETSHKQEAVHKTEQKEQQPSTKDEKEGEKVSKENKQSHSNKQSQSKQSESNKQSQKPEKPKQRHRQTH